VVLILYSDGGFYIDVESPVRVRSNMAGRPTTNMAWRRHGTGEMMVLNWWAEQKGLSRGEIRSAKPTRPRSRVEPFACRASGP
jgi:hypothetical protein